MLHWLRQRRQVVLGEGRREGQGQGQRRMETDLSGAVRGRQHKSGEEEGDRTGGGGGADWGRLCWVGETGGGAGRGLGGVGWR